jgi:hypothetical protein
MKVAKLALPYAIHWSNRKEFFALLINDLEILGESARKPSPKKSRESPIYDSLTETPSIPPIIKIRLQSI